VRVKPFRIDPARVASAVIVWMVILITATFLAKLLVKVWYW
jgi:hypothetical protein